MKRRWLELILAGEKTLEIRSRRYRPGVYFLGCEGEILARVRISNAFRVDSDESWHDLAKSHCVVERTTRMYGERCWAHELTEVLGVPRAEYDRYRGPVGVRKFWPPGGRPLGA